LNYALLLPIGALESDDPNYNPAYPNGYFKIGDELPLSHFEGLELDGGDYDGWHHFAVTFDATNPVYPRSTLYVDGVKTLESIRDNSENPEEVEILTDMGDTLPLGATIINRPVGGTSESAKGFIDELAIYTDHILSEEMVYQHSQDALVNRSHYKFVPLVSSVDIPQYNSIGVFRSKEFPIGFMENEEDVTLGLVNDYSEITCEVNNDQLSCNYSAIGALENPLEQLYNYPLPRYNSQTSLKRNFPWFNQYVLGGSRQTAEGLFGANCNYIQNAADISEELALNWHYALDMPKKSNGNCVTDPYELTRLIRDIAEEHTDIPVTAQFNQNDSRIIPSLMANANNENLNAELYYLPENIFKQHSFASTLSPFWHDGYQQAYDRYLSSPMSGTNLLNRPINFINENGEIDAHHSINHRQIWTSGIVPNVPFFDNLWFYNDNLLVEFTPEEIGYLHSDDPSVYMPVIEQWRDFTAANITSSKIAYLEGIKSFPHFANTDVSYYSVDGAGGHQGALPSDTVRWPWDILKTVGTPGTINDEENFYATPDFYPLANWRNDFGARHGIEWIERCRTIELNRNNIPFYGYDFDDLYSPFVNPGWSRDPTSNRRPGQYLGLLKCLNMLGAEFFYGTWFPDDVNYFQDPSNFIWSITIPSYAQAVMSKQDDFLFNGDILLNNGGFQSEVLGNLSSISYVRKLRDEDKYLVYASKQRVGSRYYSGDILITSLIEKVMALRVLNIRFIPEVPAKRFSLIIYSHVN